jgi:hypothetical protein
MRPINDEGAPAIYIYPESEGDYEVKLTFQGRGFMTTAAPDYNDTWRIHVNPNAPYYRYSLIHGDKTKCAFLDYDGFREGDFQTEQGWYVAQRDLFDWQRRQLSELGFLANEIDDANYTYGRRLLERKYSASHFAVYPQTTERVDTSVALQVKPAPKSVYRLWLYFVPVDAPLPNLQAPRLPRIVRDGLTVVELAYLTDREIPGSRMKATERVGQRMLASRPGHDPHPKDV